MFYFLGKVEVVKLLLKCGADVTIKDSDKKTVLHRAVESKNKEICREILNIAPALKNERDNKGKLPADYVLSPEIISYYLLD